MTGSVRYVLAAAAIGAALLSADSAHAQSAGFMRMPSTSMQYLGLGYGAGHHAPIVRTPAEHPQAMQRRTFVPPCYGTLGPACYAPVGCYGPACHGPAFGAAATPMPQQRPAGVYQPMARRPMPGYATH